MKGTTLNFVVKQLLFGSVIHSFNRYNFILEPRTGLDNTTGCFENQLLHPGPLHLNLFPS